jgi:endonuclease/exonuclease/phosphatase family metal-dependent hydrolase
VRAHPQTVPRAAPLIIAGDFNDWRHRANRQLIDQLAVVEVFEAVKGRPARTFPSVLPVFRLDRIYARGLDVIDARVHYAYPGAGCPTTRRSPRPSSWRPDDG